MEYGSDDSNPYVIQGNEPHVDPYMHIVYGMPKAEWLDEWYPCDRDTTRVVYFQIAPLSCCTTFMLHQSVHLHLLTCTCFAHCCIAADALVSAMMPCISLCTRTYATVSS